MKYATHRAHMGKTIEVKPRFESRPYKLHPGRRAHIYGELQPMDEPYEFPLWLKLFVSAFGLLAIYVTFGGNQ